MIGRSWSYDKIRKLHIELSTHCNSRCPMCPRFVSMGDGSTAPVVRPDLTLESITIENFKKWFPPDFVKQLNMVLFCGTHGDPMMAPDVLEITRYLCEHGVGIMFNTNGGMRTTEFWIQLAEILKINADPLKVRSVTFSIDGLHDTNHLYRVNVPFENAISNAKAFINAGGFAYWDFLIFKHNEHQIEEAQQIAKSIGFKFFVPKKALGFLQNHDGTVLNKIVRLKNGDVSHILEPPSDANNSNTGITHGITVSHEKKTNVPQMVEFLKNNPKTQDWRKQQWELAKNNYKPSESESSTNVVCKSLINGFSNEYQELYIDSTGNVFPCCFVGTRFHAGITMQTDHQLISSIQEFGMEKISLKKNSLREIVENGYLKTVFENRWGKEFPDGMLFCNETCGEGSAVDKIYTHDLDKRPDLFKAHIIVDKLRKGEK